MKKNGYMIYELVISFSLAFAVLFIIFNTTLNLNGRLSNLYVKNKVTSMQVLFNKKIGDDFAVYNIDNIIKDGSCTGDIYCYIINYINKDRYGNIVETITKKLNISTEKDNYYIEYGIDSNLERTKLDEDVSIDINEEIFTTNDLIESTPYNKILKLNIPMKYLEEEKNYGIELYYLYNDADDPLTIS